MYHVPMCVMCGEYEVGTFQGHEQFCSDKCADQAHEYTYDAAAGEVDILIHKYGYKKVLAAVARVI